MFLNEKPGGHRQTRLNLKSSESAERQWRTSTRERGTRVPLRRPPGTSRVFNLVTFKSTDLNQVKKPGNPKEKKNDNEQANLQEDAEKYFTQKRCCRHHKGNAESALAGQQQQPPQCACKSDFDSDLSSSVSCVCSNARKTTAFETPAFPKQTTQTKDVKARPVLPFASSLC